MPTTQLDNRPDSDSDSQNEAIRQHYADKLSGYTKPIDTEKLRADEEAGASGSDGGSGKQGNTHERDETQKLANASGSERPPSGDDKKGVSSGKSGADEKEASGTLFNDRDKPEGKGGLRGFFWGSRKRKRNTIIGGGLIAGTGGGILGLILMLSPLKIPFIMSNLQDRYFSGANSAVEQESNKLFDNYLVKKVMPGMVKNHCSSTLVQKSCALVSKDANNPASVLFDAWRNAKFENKLATDQGIEIIRSGNKFYYRSDDLQYKIFLGEYNPKSTATFNNKAFAQLSRSEVRTELQTALQSETRWKRVMMRFKVGRLLEEKYGIRRCIIACDQRDKFADAYAAKKLAAKVTILQRIQIPRTESISIVLLCITDPSCKPTDVSPDDSTLNTATNGEPTSDTDRKITQTLDSYAARYGPEKLADLVKLSQDITKGGGISTYLTNRVAEGVVGKLGGDAAAKATTKNVVSKAVPIVGWINMAAEIVDAAKNAGPKLRALTYAVNTASMVAMYEMYATVSDETKSGHMDSTELGSFNDSLSAGAQTDANGNPTGRGAEDTPLYNDIINHNPSTSTATAFIKSILPGHAYAAASTPSSAAENAGETGPCPNGEDIPAGEEICPEYQLGHADTAQKLLDALSNNPAFKFIGPVAAVWNNSFGKIFDVIGGLLGGVIQHLPGIKTVEAFAADLIAPLMHYIQQYFIPPIVTDNMSGGQRFVVAAGGADVAGNDFTHVGLGGQLLTPAQSTAILQEQENEAQQAFDHEPFFARMFSTDNPRSLVGRLAVVMPTNFGDFATSFANAVSNPLNSLSKGFGAAFSTRTVAADGGADPFGIAQYGYPAGTIPSDPETYWNTHCTTDDQTKAWNQAAADNIDDQTGQPTNTTTNPCLLIKATVASVGATTTTKVLSADDLGSSQ